MKIKRKITEVPIRNRADVLVVGAGPAGFGAAVTAARGGAKVTLVERGGMAGGMWTLGLVSPFFDNKNKGGLNRELREALEKNGSWGGLWNIAFDPTAMVMLLDEYLLESGVDFLPYTMAVETVVEDNRVTGVIIENKSGAQAILAGVVIDCTGDGDVAALAGAEYRIGREDSGGCQPMTMMFKLGGVREEYDRDNVIGWYRELVKRVPENEVLPQIPFNFPAIIKLPRRGEALIQWTHIRRMSAIDGDDLAKAVLEGRRQVRQAMEFLKKLPDILGEVYLLELPELIGVRESRRIVGEYTVSDDDVRNGTSHPDAVCKVNFGVDIHEPEEKSQTNIKSPGFEIPYRALLPKGLDGLLTAGRCISGSFMAHAAYRVTGDCLAMGEAAGHAAACALENNISLREVQFPSLV